MLGVATFSSLATENLFSGADQKDHGFVGTCFSFLFVSFDETVVSLLLVFVDSYKSDKVWSMSTSPRAHRLSFISLG